MRKLSFIASALFALALIVAPQQVEAQTTIEVGPRLGIDLGDASDIGGDFFIGAEGRIGTDALPVIINPSFDYYFVDSPEGVDRSLIAIDINALYEFGMITKRSRPTQEAELESLGFPSVRRVLTFRGSAPLEADRRALPK